MRKIFIAFLALPLFACQSHQAPANAAPSSADARADALIKQMTLEEKISLLGGDTDHFSTHAVARLGVPKLVMADGPQGIRNYPRLRGTHSWPRRTARRWAWRPGRVG
jgi:hypothetical protein